MSLWLTMIEVAVLQSDAFWCGRVVHAARRPRTTGGHPWLPGFREAIFLHMLKYPPAGAALSRVAA
jgi:hypothetical protein